MDSYRPHSRAGQRFCTFHMFVDELCLQLIGDYRTAVHRHEARAQQSDLLRLQGVGQHHPERSPAANGNNLCMVCCAKYNKYLKKHPATPYRNMPHKWRKPRYGVPHATSTFTLHTTGRNKPPGESQAVAATAASYTHCLWPGVSAPSPAPHLRASLT